MSHWKDELHGIAGRFDEQMARMSESVQKKAAKKSSRKSLQVASVLSAVAVVIGILIFSWSSGPAIKTSYSPSAPVYYDEALYQYYVSRAALADETAQKESAFHSYITMLGYEHHLRQDGFSYTDEQYQTIYNNSLAQIDGLDDVAQLQGIEQAAASLNISKTEYVEEILVSALTKIEYIISNVSGLELELEELSDIVYGFYDKYDGQIVKLAEQLGVPYEKPSKPMSYTGRVVAKDGSSYLLVEGASVEDVVTLEAMDIVQKYETGIWIRQLQVQQEFLVGDVVHAMYDAVDLSLPASADGKLMKLVERVDRPIFVKDEALFRYHVASIDPLHAEYREETAFLTMVWNMMLEYYAFQHGFKFDPIAYSEMEAQVREAYASSTDEPHEGLARVADELSMSYDEFLNKYEIPIVAKGQLISNYIDTLNVDVMNDVLAMYEMVYEKELRLLAEQLGTQFTRTEFNVE